MAQIPFRPDADEGPTTFPNGIPGITRFGGNRVQELVHIANPDVNSPTNDPDDQINRPAVLALDAVNATTGAVTTNFLWVDGNGKLRIATTFPVTADSDGVVVGSQS